MSQEFFGSDFTLHLNQETSLKNKAVFPSSLETSQTSKIYVYYIYALQLNPTKPQPQRAERVAVGRGGGYAFLKTLLSSTPNLS